MLDEKQRLVARGTRTGAFVTEEAAAELAEMSVSGFENASQCQQKPQKMNLIFWH